MARVSICIPNLNMRSFLPERFDSIFRQTFRDWELFVYDSYSDDGSWEYICERAAGDSRITIAQGPREGPYAAWNECVRRTGGEYIYIATADDTMAPNCLAELAAALDRHPACGLAHCSLRITDVNGALLEKRTWPHATVFALGLEGVINQPHIRHAPHDGLMHLTGRHVYLSITQLLIRRTLLSKTGPFAVQWGPTSDFNWEMKAGLLTDTVHVPNTWATWTIHERQLTTTAKAGSSDKAQKVEEMIDDALGACASARSKDAIDEPWIQFSRELREYYSVLRHTPSVPRRRIYQAGCLVTGPGIIRKEILRRFATGSEWTLRMATEIRQRLERAQQRPPITLASGADDT